jgi:glycolate oxidase iron-sulfur subunit
MQHTIPIDQIHMPQAEEMAHAVSTCVHCGFCLAACPTYLVMNEEMDSPRGRIVLMRDVLEGKLPLAEAQDHIDKCLGCLGCVTACPSGVPYGELITSFRAYAEPKRERDVLDKLSRALVRNTLPYPARFKAASALGKLLKPLAGLLPKPLAAMLALVPDGLPDAAEQLPELYPAIGPRRARVALLAGCVQQVLAPQINWATLKVLAANGVEVVIPKGQGCCGSLGMHTGDAQSARALAQVNLDVFPQDVDAVITNAAGCGSGMKEYGLLFKGTPHEERAQVLAKRTMDVCEFLDNLGLIEPKPLPKAMRVAYHDACHLAHAQGVVGAPRRLLKAVPNLTLLEISEGEICCGSAGTYNIEQPEVANALGERKARNVLKTQADLVATGNIGCMVQLKSNLKKMGQATPVMHTVELLAMALRRP